MSDASVTPYKVDLSTAAIIRRARALISGKYALFLGISVAGVVVGGAIPPAILMGAMLCGIYDCYRKHDSGQAVELSDLFKGFDHFVQGLIATLVILVTTVVTTGPFIAAFIIGLAMLDSPGDAESALGTTLIAGSAAAIFLIKVVLRTLTQFTYPLILDRKLTAFEAIRTSARGAWMNLTSVLATEFVASLALFVFGTCTCFVGIWFLLPFYFAMNWVEYTEIFADVEVDSEEETVFVDDEEDELG